MAGRSPQELAETFAAQSAHSEQNREGNAYYMTLSKKDLQTLIKDRRTAGRHWLAISGNKPELISRLLEDDQRQEAEQRARVSSASFPVEPTMSMDDILSIQRPHALENYNSDEDQVVDMSGYHNPDSDDNSNEEKEIEPEPYYQSPSY